jgi:uncharacterized damage-inducible protein DinB
MKDSLTEVLKSLFRRDLNRLKEEVSAYKNESNLWIVEKEISNSGGNLALHLIGNLRAFIGAELGDTGYIRKRDEEFSLKNVAREDMLREIDLTISEIDQVLDQLPVETLKSAYPRKVFKDEMTTEYFLVHLASHLGYHLGQLNYHRRLLD